MWCFWVPHLQNQSTMGSGVQKQQHETAERDRGCTQSHREKTSTNHETMSTEHLSQRDYCDQRATHGTKTRNAQTHGCCAKCRAENCSQQNGRRGPPTAMVSVQYPYVQQHFCPRWVRTYCKAQEAVTHTPKEREKRKLWYNPYAALDMPLPCTAAPPLQRQHKEQAKKRASQTRGEKSASQTREKARGTFL